MIRRPSCCDTSRNPNASVLRNHLPIAVIVQIVVAINVAGHILRRCRAIFSLVALLAPAFEIIKARSWLSIVGKLISSPKRVLLAGAEIVRFTAAGHLPSAFPHDDQRRIAVWISFDSIFTGAG